MQIHACVVRAEEPRAEDEPAVAPAGDVVLRLQGGLVEGVVEAVVLVWVGVREAEVEEGVGLRVGRAPEVFQPFLVGAGFGEGGAEDGVVDGELAGLRLR